METETMDMCVRKGSSTAGADRGYKPNPSHPRPAQPEALTARPIPEDSPAQLRPNSSPAQPSPTERGGGGELSDVLSLCCSLTLEMFAHLIKTLSTGLPQLKTSRSPALALGDPNSITRYRSHRNLRVNCYIMITSTTFCSHFGSSIFYAGVWR